MKLKMQLYETVATYYDLFYKSTEELAQRTGYYEDKCYFYRLLGDLCRYGLQIGM